MMDLKRKKSLQQICLALQACVAFISIRVLHYSTAASWEGHIPFLSKVQNAD